MKIDQNRMGNQDVQSKLAKKSEKNEKAGQQREHKDRVGGDTKGFKQIFAQTAEKGQASGPATSSGPASDLKQSGRETGRLAGKEELPMRDEGLSGSMFEKEQRELESAFDGEKQRLGEIGEALKEQVIDEQAILTGAVGEMPDGHGIQQTADAGPAAGTDRAEVAQLANKIVEAFYVGQDARAKKIVMMDVNVPGRGSVRVRLSKTGDSVDVRMRADNEDLARLLRAHREDLRESGASKGVNFANIEVVG